MGRLAGSPVSGIGAVDPLLPLSSILDLLWLALSLDIFSPSVVICLEVRREEPGEGDPNGVCCDISAFRRKHSRNRFPDD